MKKILFKSVSVFLAMVLLVAQTHALSAKTIEVGLPSIDESVFSLDENALNQAMNKLNKLENYLANNEGTTYDDLLASGSDLITNVSDTSAPLGMAQTGEDPLGIPAFWWGCVLGWVGILLVYLVSDNDKPQTKKALKGCLVNGGVVLVLYVVYAALLVETVNTGYYY